MAKEPVLMWPFLRQFLTYLTDFAILEVVDDALSSLGILILKLFVT